MPDGAKTLLVILLIPFLLALGHDLYINYFSDDEKIREVKALRIDPEKFLISDAGWVWNEYSASTMEATRGMIDPETWTAKLDPVLQLPTMIVGLIPWAMTLVYLSFSALFGFWPCTNSVISFGGKRRRKNDDFAVYKHAKTKSVKYKKK